MTLTHQFIITLTLPAAFLLLSLYTWRWCRIRTYGAYWSLTLFMAALWSSSVLSYYLGVALPAEIAFAWRAIAHHIFSAVSFTVLLTTTAFLRTARAHRRLLFALSIFFWLLSLLLDPAFQPLGPVTWLDSAQANAQFHLWSAFWVTAWLLPLLASIMLTRDAMRSTASAHYRNRLNYWQTTLVLMTLGGAVALIQQPGQPAWQELGGLGVLLAAIMGTRTIVLSSLTNLRVTFRHALARLAASLVTLALIWLSLYAIINGMPAQGRNLTVLELGLVAAFLTLFVGAVNSYIPRLVRRILLRGKQAPRIDLSDEPALTADLPNPAALGEILLRLTQFNITTEKAQLLLVEEQGDQDDHDQHYYLLRQIAGIGEVEGQEPIAIAASSPLVEQLLQRPAEPLSTYELESLPAFAEGPSELRERLRQGHVEMIMPLCARDELVGLLALGEKFTGESYTPEELSWLQDVGAHGGLLLWQAKALQRNMAGLERARDSRREIELETQRLRELVTLHDRFTQLIGPTLREPFSKIHLTLDAIEQEAKTAGSRRAVRDLNGQLAELQLALDSLIINAGRIRRQHHLSFTELDLGEIVNKAVRDLQTMSSARRVSVNVLPVTQLPAIEGDWQRLYDAVQHLLHNAIRFNRIGGCVDLEYGVAEGQVYLHVRDDGVGIPEEQLAQIWTSNGAEEDEIAASAGAGLGLALTRFVIRAHGGYMDVQSSSGLGSTFSIYLPSPALQSSETTPL